MKKMINLRQEVFNIKVKLTDFYKLIASTGLKNRELGIVCFYTPHFILLTKNDKQCIIKA